MIINNNLMTAGKSLLKLVLDLRLLQVEGGAQGTITCGCNKVQEQYRYVDSHLFTRSYQVIGLLEGHLRQHRNRIQCTPAWVNQKAAQTLEFSRHVHQSLGDFGERKSSPIFHEYAKKQADPLVDEFWKL